MVRTRISIWLALIAGIACVALNTQAPKRPANLPPEAAVLRPDVARLIFHGQLPLLVDFYWLQVIHTIGAARTPEDALRLYQYGKFLAEMDPKFYDPYWVVGINVPWSLGREQWKYCDEATDMYNRGLAQFPVDLKLESYLAWDYFECKKDFRQAAETLKLISTNPQAPKWTWSLATRLYAMSGSISDAKALVEDLNNTATTDEERALFSRRLADLETEEVLQKVDVAIEQYMKDKGIAPASVDDLFFARYLPEEPVDPNGGDITIGDDNRAHSTSQGRRLEVFIDERARRSN